MSLLILHAGREKAAPTKEMDMELLAGMPEWLVWCAAGGVGVLALATLAKFLDVALELDAG